MNEFERRQIEVANNHVDLLSVARSFGKEALIEHFGYTLQLGSVATPFTNGTAFQGIIQLQADAYFVLQYISTCVIKPDVPMYMQQSGNINLQITDTGAGEVLFNQANRAGILTGTCVRAQTGIPMLLPIPRVILPSTNIKIEATQQGVNVSDNQAPIAFYVSLLGSRIAQV